MDPDEEILARKASPPALETPGEPEYPAIKTEALSSDALHVVPTSKSFPPIFLDQATDPLEAETSISKIS